MSTTIRVCYFEGAGNGFFPSHTATLFHDYLLQFYFTIYSLLEFLNISDIRAYILDVLKGYFQKYQSGGIIDFEGLSKKNLENAFIKIGRGSLGGKARGIAFIKSLITKGHLSDEYEGITIKVPRSFVICSDAFELFIENNKIYDFVANTKDERKIAEKFMETELPATIQNNLAVLIQYVKCPLAVRSSSILEDSRVLPFAGIYKTYIVPNSHNDPAVRLKQLSDAVKLVFASVFYASPVQYAQNADIRIEEEKMAVLIQELVGERYGDLYYPVISGVAQSYNFYPYYPMKPEDGTVSLALGYGKAIAEGERVYRYSPAHPKLNPIYASTKDYFENSQTTFYALNLEASSNITLCSDDNYNTDYVVSSEQVSSELRTSQKSAFCIIFDVFLCENHVKTLTRYGV